MIKKSIEHNKALFIEKLLCTTAEELDELSALFEEPGDFPPLFVGHNRRYSSHMLKVKEFFDSRSRPLVMSMVVNAGFVPADHWVHSTGEGRSRIVGEMTHFLDLFQFLSGSMIAKVYAERIFGANRRRSK